VDKRCFSRKRQVGRDRALKKKDALLGLLLQCFPGVRGNVRVAGGEEAGRKAELSSIEKGTFACWVSESGQRYRGFKT